MPDARVQDPAGLRQGFVLYNTVAMQEIAC
ncbi:hypothetical protein SAMN05518670_0547 [Paenibacillus sp. OK076]|nr:hypothetical protein SAMN05518670_0547 [Paenibacillus sp. OK076]